MNDDKVAAGMKLLDQEGAPRVEKKPSVPSRASMDESKLLARVAKDGFLRSYVQYCADTTDAPHVFHLGVGLGILGAALGNKVHIPSWADQEIYPNIWLVLIAPSGFMRKSASLRLGKGLLFQAVPKTLLPDDWTPEKLANILQDNPAGLLTISEFTRILEMMARDYSRGAKEMLTELYDSPAAWVVARQQTEEVAIQNAAVSILGGTTLDWLGNRVKNEDLRGGFLARFLFLPATKRGPRIEKQPSVNAVIRPKLCEYLRKVNKLEGVADFSKVWTAFSNWLRDYEDMIETEEMTPELMGMYARTGTTTLKIALIMQASLKPQTEITPEAMQRAITFVEYVHRATARVTEHFADSWFGKQMQRVIDYLELRGGEAGRSEVLRYSKLKSRQLDEVIGTLRESGRIDIKKADEDGKSGPAATIYVLKEG